MTSGGGAWRRGRSSAGLTKDLRLTQELLGHASPATTAIYTKLDPRGAEVVRELGARQP